MKLSSKQLAETAVELLQDKEGKALEDGSQALLAWLQERHEAHRLPEILRAMDEVWRKRFGAANIWVASAHPLTREARKALERAAAGATIRDTVEPHLIAGARIRIDDRIIDGSLRGALSQLQESLLEN